MNLVSNFPHQFMKIKKLIPCLFVPALIAASFAFVRANNKEVEKTSALNVLGTDMSDVELLPGESINEMAVLYDDFSSSSLDANWVVSHRKWGGYDNKGVSADNVFLDRENKKLVIRALGNQHVENSTVNGIGGPVSAGAVVLKEAARPGRYEVKMKAAYRVGVCNAMWTYTEDGQGNNHEIDIEFPFKTNRGNNAFNEVIFTNYIGESNFQQTHSKLNYYLNDGEYHTYAFDWYYSSSHKVIRYYIDSHLLATHTLSAKLPYLPSRLWLGCWVPNNPGFVGLPDFDQCFMEIDYFKYSPFKNQEDVTKGNAGGCGNTSNAYHIINQGFEKYDWMSNGSFNAINKNQSITDRGYEVTGNTLLNNSFDHEGRAGSGGLKMGTNSSITNKIDSTYPGFTYKLSTYYKGSGRAYMLFYNETNDMFKALTLVLPNKDSWGPINYNFEVPNDTFYTKIKFESTDQELYLDDISVIFSKDAVVEVILTSITLSGPNKTTYQIGDTLNLVGLVVTAHYSDGSSKVVTDYQVSEVDLSTPGTKTVTITYQDQTASFTITVDEEGHSSVILTSIKLEGSFRTQYNVNEELDLKGLTVRGYYSDGSSKEVTGYRVGSVDMTTPGVKRVNITYVSKMTYFEITVSEITKNAEVPSYIPLIVVSSAIVGTIGLTFIILAAAGVFKKKKPI